MISHPAFGQFLWIFLQLSSVVADGKDVSIGATTGVDNLLLTSRVFEANMLSHKIGQESGDAWSVTASRPAADYMSFGPYVDNLEPGNLTVTFNVMADLTITVNFLLATLDVFDVTAGVVLAKRDLFRGSFMLADEYEPFSLQYSQQAGHKMEFRMFWHDAGYLRHKQTTVSRDEINFAAKSLQHNVGIEYKDGWSVTSLRVRPDYLSSGPHVEDLPAGSWSATFELLVNTVLSDSAVATIDVFDTTDARVLSKLYLNGSAFSKTMHYLPFTLKYDQVAGHKTEFRVFWHGIGHLRHRRVTLVREHEARALSDHGVEESGALEKEEDLADVTESGVNDWMKIIHAEMHSKSRDIMTAFGIVILCVLLSKYSPALHWRGWLDVMQKPFGLEQKNDTDLQILLESTKERVRRMADELSAKEKVIAVLQDELEANVSDIIKVEDCRCSLGSDFGFVVYDEELNEEPYRFVKIQCPGVASNDISIEVLLNGCIVTMHRKASRGVEPTEWTRRVIFARRDGIFEFKDDLAQLDAGFLQIGFQKLERHRRLFNFSQCSKVPNTDDAHNSTLTAGIVEPSPEPSYVLATEDSATSALQSSQPSEETTAPAPAAGCQGGESAVAGPQSSWFPQ